MEEGGPHTVTATSEGCTISLDNVMFGDVWICAGQSNMAFKLETVINTTSLLSFISTKKVLFLVWLFVHLTVCLFVFKITLK